MMHLSQNLLSGKRKYLFAGILLSIISVIYAVFSKNDSNDFDIARREVLLRRIGHEILLQSGDNTSRVLPIKKIAENVYQIRFEKELAFQPDSLVNITRRILSQDLHARDYVVNVLNCANAGVVYAYAVSNNKKDDIVSCQGRKQPMACYVINIKFKSTGITTVKNKYFLGALLFFAFVGFIFLRSVKRAKPFPESQPADTIALGPMSFDAETRKLMINGENIELTRTEARVLRIFAMSPNKTIERSRLQKEIWEDEGVVVGRSLDMFISKLRKKLERDPNIKIVVIRGKGYKLEISS